jgi:hypothetical protein
MENLWIVNAGRMMETNVFVKILIDILNLIIHVNTNPHPKHLSKSPAVAAN